jgi:hypothetical protein
MKFTLLNLRVRRAVVALIGLVVTMLATGPKVCGFKPDQRWIFKGDKNLQHDLLQRGSKAIGPML